MVVVRIFYEKLQEVIEDVMKRHCFGRVKSFVYSVEHQKRGMPHIHMVITLDEVGCFRFSALPLEPLIRLSSPSGRATSRRIGSFWLIRLCRQYHHRDHSLGSR